MRCIPKDWRRGGVLECMKNDQIKAIVEEAEYQEAVKQGYYDEDGNWIYYTEAELAAQSAVQPAAQPQKPIQNQKVVRIYEIFLLQSCLKSRSSLMVYKPVLNCHNIHEIFKLFQIFVNETLSIFILGSENCLLFFT